MMIHAPKLGLETAEIFIALSVADFLADCGFDVAGIAKCTPSAAKLKEMMVEEAVDSIILEKRAMRDMPLTIMADKGEGESKRDGASFVKLAASYDDEHGKVNVSFIGIQSAGNTSKDAAMGVDNALLLFDDVDRKQVLDNGGTDAGGGGTREDIGLKLNNVGRVKEWDEFLASTCGLHGMNLTLASPTTLVMGDGALLRRNAMQLLHTAYNLSQYYRTA